MCLCLRADRSAHGPSKPSLHTAAGSIRGGGSLHDRVSIFLALLSVISFVGQKLVSQPAVLQEELLYK